MTNRISETGRADLVVTELRNELPGRIRGSYDIPTMMYRFTWFPEEGNDQFVEVAITKEQARGISDFKDFIKSMLEERYRRLRPLSGTTIFGQDIWRSREFGPGARLFTETGQPLGIISDIEMVTTPSVYGTLGGSDVFLNIKLNANMTGIANIVQRDLAEQETRGQLRRDRERLTVAYVDQSRLNASFLSEDEAMTDTAAIPVEYVEVELGEGIAPPEPIEEEVYSIADMFEDGGTV